MANFNFNQVILGGRLTADPELKTTSTGKSVTSFTVAYNRSRQDSETTDFFNVTAWDKKAEFITRFFHKSSSICVSGRLQNRSWTDQNGQKRFATDIIADEVYFVDSKSEAPAIVQQTRASQPESESAPNFEDVTNDEELPF